MKLRKQKLTKSMLKYLWRNLAFLLVWSLLALPFIVFAVTGKAGFASVINLPYSSTENLSKKVFAKALFDVYKPKTTKTTNCYKDISKKDSNAAAICALKKAKVFPASAKTFSPDSKTNWEFAITSLCKAEKWPGSKTFTSCSKYAKKHGFLVSPPMPAKINKKTPITYGELVAFLDLIKSAPANVKTSGTTSKPADNIASQITVGNVTVPSKKTEEINFSPIKEGTINVNFFSNVRLSSEIKNTFYKDEVFFVEGDVVGKTTDEVLVFLCKKNYGCDKSTNFIGKTSENHFKIPVFFRELGNFQIGIIPGRSGQSNIDDISVIPESLLTPSGGKAADSLSVGYAAGKTTFRWNGEGTHTNLIIFQDSTRKDFILRQGDTSFSPPSSDLTGFKKGDAYWMVTQNGLPSSIAKISLTVQDFRKIESDKIQITELAEVFRTPGQLQFAAKALTTISKKAAVTLPNGQVKLLTIGQNDIPAEQNFQIATSLDSFGTYIFEVNSPDGNAVVNVPIYVGDSIPLLPDAFALYEDQALDTSPLSDLNQARQKILQLINADRDDYSLPTVVLANDLNVIAQTHSENMVRLNFFAHVDPAGNSPDMRRKNAKITTPIRENLGKAASLESVEAGLMRSPVHRDAILDPEMKRVGIGIAKDSEGYFLTTQNFASNPITQDSLPSTEDGLFDKANAKRASENLLQFTHNTSLRNISSSWSSRMASEGFFGVTDKSGQQLLDVIRASGVRSSMNVNVVEVSAIAQLEDELLKQAPFLDSLNRNIGIGLSINSVGEIFMTVIYTP